MTEFIWTFTDDQTNWEDLANLYKIAPLGNKNPNDLKIIFGNSMYKCFIYDGDKLIGAGRTIADGVDVSYLCDIAVHPDYQRRGIGNQIVRKLLDFSNGYNKILLFASVGKEPFYSKLGFDKIFKLNTTSIKLCILLSALVLQGCSTTTPNHLQYPEQKCVYELEGWGNINCYANPNATERQECLNQQNQLRNAIKCK